MADTKPVEQRRNSFDDSDLAQVIERIEAAKAKEADTKATAAADRKRTIKVIEAEAKNVGIPLKSLRKTLKVRALQQKIEAEVQGVPDNEIELFFDMQGQSSWLAPDEGHPTESDAQIAARRRIAEIQKVTDVEQAEGAAALDELAGAVH